MDVASSPEENQHPTVFLVGWDLLDLQNTQAHHYSWAWLGDAWQDIDTFSREVSLRICPLTLAVAPS